MFSYSGLVYKVCRDSFVTSIKPVLVRICFPPVHQHSSLPVVWTTLLRSTVDLWNFSFRPPSMSQAFQSETKPQHIFPLNCGNSQYIIRLPHPFNVTGPPTLSQHFLLHSPCLLGQRQRPPICHVMSSCWLGRPLGQWKQHSWGSQMAFSPFCGNVCPRKHATSTGRGGGVLPGGYGA